MRALGDIAAIVEGARALQLRILAGFDARSRRLAARPRITPLRLVHPDEIEPVRKLDKAS
jgi:hypothetical protein